ncbi:hypothetical protein [Campylobacter sp.]|nr:hypothetical protein [Campylobacter sp.]
MSGQAQRCGEVKFSFDRSRLNLRREFIAAHAVAQSAPNLTTKFNERRK